MADHKHIYSKKEKSKSLTHQVSILIVPSTDATNSHSGKHKTQLTKNNIETKLNHKYTTHAQSIFHFNLSLR